MSIFSWIFGPSSKDDNSEDYKSSELVRLFNFEKGLESLLNTDSYIARSDYKHLCDCYSEIYNQFSAIQKSKTLDYYCSQNHIDIQRIEDFLATYSDLCKNESAEIVTLHNKYFLEKHLISLFSSMIFS